MTDAHAETGSLLGKDSEFTGKLTFLGTVRIEGRFEGEVLAEGTLVVAAGGFLLSQSGTATTGGIVPYFVLPAIALSLAPWLIGTGLAAVVGAVLVHALRWRE